VIIDFEFYGAKHEWIGTSILHSQVPWRFPAGPYIDPELLHKVPSVTSAESRAAHFGDLDLYDSFTHGRTARDENGDVYVALPSPTPHRDAAVRLDWIEPNAQLWSMCPLGPSGEDGSGSDELGDLKFLPANLQSAILSLVPAGSPGGVIVAGFM